MSHCYYNVNNLEESVEELQCSALHANVMVDSIMIHRHNIGGNREIG